MEARGDGWENNGNGASPSKSSNSSAEKLAYDLEGWREVIVRFEGVLNWDQPKVLGIIIGATTILFLFIWYCDTPILTTVALLGLLAALADYSVPLLSSKFLTQGAEWSGNQERQYLAICRRLVNAKDHVKGMFLWLGTMRRERPTMYFAVVVPTLLALAFIGATFNSLFLTYVLIVFLLLLPGLRHHGILQQGASQILAKIRGLTSKKDK